MGKNYILSDMILLCRICLQGDIKLTVMNCQDLNIFKTIFVKIPICPETSYLCVYCRHIMKKLEKFYRQCINADEYYSQLMKNNSLQNDVTVLPKAVDLKICRITKEICIQENEYEEHEVLKKENERSLVETCDYSSEDSNKKSNRKFEQFSDCADNFNYEVKDESQNLEENLVYNLDEVSATTLSNSSKKDLLKECKRKTKRDEFSDCADNLDYEVKEESQDTKQNLVYNRGEVTETLCNSSKKDLLKESNDYEFTESPKYDHTSKSSAEETKEFEENDAFSDDEVPLAQLRENSSADSSKIREGKQKRSCKRKDTFEEPTGNTGSEQRRRKWKTAKNCPRDGFSSKMVAETDEYTVIKMTKDQVLQEMAEKSKCENYTLRPHKCEQCVIGFNFEDVLQNHLQRHIPRPGYLECDICHQFCASAVSLRGHMKSHTTRYKCKICDVVKLSRQHLLEHHALQHTGVVTTYTCEHCPFTSNKRTIIQRHVRSHSSKDSHTCDKCGKLFPNITALRAHVVRHSTMAACEQCGRKFISLSLLHAHVTAVHERRDFYCVECDVTFQSAYNLQLHLKRTRRHRDESSYRFKCPRCPRRFVYQSGVTAHLCASHGQLASHACPQCDNRYPTAHALRAHVRRTHGDVIAMSTA